MGDRAKRGGGFRAASYGRPRLWIRLWQLRLGHGLILLAPALVICAWYAGAAVLSHGRYARAIGVEQPLTAEIFHLHLHDHLSRDLRRLSAPSADDVKGLPSLNLHLSNAHLDALNDAVPPEDGKGGYVGGVLEGDGKFWDVEVRYRGRRHTHWLNAQKSWKVQVRGGAFMGGLDTFNFINTPDPMPFDELIVMELAREGGLLTPDYHPFQLQINNAPMGIHFFSAQPDEGLLRNSRRIPGSMYSGNGAPVDEATGVSWLWREAKHWKKVAARLGIKGAMKDYGELERLLEMVNGAGDVAFSRFVRDHIDLRRFAVFDALDVIFGGNQHDFDQNHKLYFDPYKARFEPVAWNFRGWDHRRAVNRVENPLQIRLKGIPGYLLMRDRVVLDLLKGAASPGALRGRIERLLGELAEAQRADPYWDAWHLLPRMDPYHRQLVRPMDEARQAVVLDARYNLFVERAAYLTGALTSGDLAVEVRAVPAAAALTSVELVVSGPGGIRLSGLSATWPDGCAPSHWSLSADTNLDRTPFGDRDLGSATGPDAEIGLGLELLPGIVLEPRPPNPKRGAVRVADQARRYRLYVHGAGCTPERVRVRAVDLLTEAPLTREAAPGSALVPPGAVGPCGSAVLPGQAGFASVHPWCHPAEATELVRLGPGIVYFPETRVFQAGERVEIRPGTTLQMLPRSSLVFLGPVRAEGTEAAPIQIRGSDWGGVAIQGPGTAGSVLTWVTVEGGSRPEWGLGAFPGMLNLHDTRDIAIDDLRLRDAQGSADVFHVAYVDDLRFNRVRIDGPPMDGIDLEFSAGTITGLTVLDAGDEALDLMGAQLTVEDAVLVGFGGSGISAGEETRLRLQNSLVSGGAVAVLVKNASGVRLRDVLLHDVKIALDLKHLSARYIGDARARTRRVHKMDCRAGAVSDRPWRSDAPRIKGAPDEDELLDLKTRLLGIDTWDDLEAGLARLGSGGGR
ncbi:MAG: CotH kinase family protein [Pseudomonadota bacterium]